MDDVLSCDCPHCHHTWKPYGNERIKVPASLILDCPSCKASSKYDWFDDETRKLLAQKSLGLSNSDESIKKLQNMEYKLELLTKEVELEKKKRELSDAELEKIVFWAEDREEDFRLIETLAQELDEEHKFKEDNK